jgi:photosystem II stability/assembly factor-like uncharacterized protein
MRYLFSYPNYWLFTLITLALSIAPAKTQSPATWADTNLYSGLEFRNIGPTRGGRVTSVAGIASQPGTFFMGATGGGVWKTTDYGQSWTNISDGYFASPSIGAIRVAPSNPQIVYVGTGSDGLRSNVIAGKGVYKSTDQGKTWTHTGLEKTGHIGAVEVHPENPDVAFVAAIGQAFEANPERGLYRTQDGGETWEKVLHISDTTGIADVEFHPTDPDVLYAAAWRAERKPWTIISGGKEGGVYRSTDGGSTWTKLTKGLPQGIIGKADLAVSPAAPDRVYALIEAPEGIGGLYRSEDRGESWSLISTKKELLDRPFYYCNVDVNPKNADAVYVNATRFWRSYNGGKSWKRLGTPHGDNHDLWISPNDTLLWVQCNDGGANITRDGGHTWSTQHNQPTAELYQVEADDQFPYWVYAGQQDNTTIALPNNPPLNTNPPAGPEAYWMDVGGCETGPAVPKPGNPNIVYANCKGRFSVFDKRTGQEKGYYVTGQYMYGHNPKDLILRFQRVSPIHVSPHDPDVVYHTSQYVHKTTDEGVTWETISPDLTAFEPDKQVISGTPITRDITGEEFYSTIYAIRESPLEEGLIWVGANDGPVHVTRDGGRSWSKVTPEDLAGGGRVDAMEPSPHAPGKAYISVLRYQLGDWKPYAYKTEDYGQHWTLLTDGHNGIPADFPVRVVREDPEREGLLYAGTEYGLFISFDDGRSWRPFQQNLPVTPVTDIKVHRGDLVLSTMGRGFWIMDNLSALHQLSDEVAQADVCLFDPADQYRMRYRSRRSVPEYPGPHALIDYYLAKTPEGELTLEILDAEKKVVRAYTSAKPAKDSTSQPEESDMATGFFTPGFSSDLKKSAGMHRFTWDMRHPGPWDEDEKRSGRGGPMVAPGQYFVRLTAGETSQTKAFNLLIDPRVIAAGVSAGDLRDQEQLTLQVVQLESQAKQLAEAIKGERKALKEKVNKGKRKAVQTDEPLAELEAQLVTAEGRYRRPMLIDQARYLRGMLEGADQRPGKDAFERYETLKTQFNQLIGRWQELMGEETDWKQLD